MKTIAHDPLILWSITLLILSLSLTNPVQAKPSQCQLWQKRHHQAVKHKSPARHKLAELLWVKCGV